MVNVTKGTAERGFTMVGVKGVFAERGFLVPLFLHLKLLLTSSNGFFRRAWYCLVDLFMCIISDCRAFAHCHGCIYKPEKNSIIA